MEYLYGIAWGIVAILLIMNYYYISKPNTFEEFQTKLPLFVINLERSRNRWRRMKEQLDTQQFNYKRANAVDGKTHILTRQERNLFQNCKAEIKQRKGVIGCALSHYSVWEDMIRNKIEGCFVCEDDLVFRDKCQSAIAVIQDSIPLYDIVFFYNTIGDKKTRYITEEEAQNNVILPYTRLEWLGFGAVMYYINLHAAKHLLRVSRQNHNICEVDWFMYKQLRQLRIGYTKYPLVSLQEVPSIRLELDNPR